MKLIIDVRVASGMKNSTFKTSFLGSLWLRTESEQKQFYSCLLEQKRRSGVSIANRQVLDSETFDGCFEAPFHVYLASHLCLMLDINFVYTLSNIIDNKPSVTKLERIFQSGPKAF